MFVPNDRFINIDLINTCYWEEGQGPPLILLHGMGGSAAGWLPCIDNLKKFYKVYVLEMVGHGSTGGSANEMEGINDMAKFVIHFMDAMNIDQAAIVGHSMGAVISLELTIKYQDRVSKLVIADSSGLGRGVTPIFRLLSTPVLGEILLKSTIAKDMETFVRQKRKEFSNAPSVTNELAQQLFIKEYKPDQYRTTLKLLRKGFNWFGQRKEFRAPILQGLPQITCPTLIIWGRQDTIVPYKHGEVAAQNIPDSTLQVIDNCGHVPMFEQPEIFNQLILEFLGT
ncbi:alpha/beta fold hydrolase [Chloroflexota bacterium]